MTLDYQDSIARTKQHRTTIQSYRSLCAAHPENPLRTTSPIKSAKDGWFDVVYACEESIEIYKKWFFRK